MSPDGATVNQIDHICISRRWQTALQDVRVYCRPDVASDHYLLVAKLKLKLEQRRSTKKRAQTFDDGKFKQPGVKMAFDIELSDRFAVLETVDSVEGTWSNFRNTVVQAAEKVVGYRRGTRGGSVMTRGRLSTKENNGSHRNS